MYCTILDVLSGGCYLSPESYSGDFKTSLSFYSMIILLMIYFLLFHHGRGLLGIIEFHCDMPFIFSANRRRKYENPKISFDGPLSVAALSSATRRDYISVCIGDSIGSILLSNIFFLGGGVEEHSTPLFVLT